MATASYVRGDFSGGEISKFAQGRYDLPSYPKSLNVCLNGIPIEPGTWVRRPGTRYICQTYAGRAGALFSFAFKNSLPYTIELTAGFCRFIAPVQSTVGLGLVGSNDAKSIVAISTANPAVVQTSGAHGWSTNDHVLIPGIAYLNYREFVIAVIDATHFSIAEQANGLTIDGSLIGALPVGVLAIRVLILAAPYGAPGTSTGIDQTRKVQAETTAILLHPAVKPYALTTTNTAGSAIPPPYGPFYQFNLAAATFKDGPYIDQYIGTTISSSGTSGSVTLTTGGAAFPGFQAGDVGRLIRLFSQPAQWISTTSYVTGNVVSVMPDPFNQPGVATYWVATGATTGNTPPLSPSVWSPAVNGLAGGNSSASFTTIGASGSSPGQSFGTSSGGVLPTSNSGGSVATWTWGTITAVNAPNQIVVTINGNDLVNTSTIYAWRMGAYGGANGYPTCGVYDGDRLWLGGAIANRVDACAVGGINGGTINFAPTNADGTVGAANAIAATFAADDVNAAVWMAHHQQGIICGTKGGEWLVFAPTAGGFAPNNIGARRVTQIGCANVEVRYAEHTLLFVQRYTRKIIEYFADVFSGKLAGPNLSLLWKHLTKSGIQDIAYQQELSPNVWMRVNNALIGCTYKRDSLTSAQGPTTVGAHRHVLGTLRDVESISVGPSADGTTDSLMMITNFAAAPLRQIEVLTDILDEGSTLLQAQYVDSALAPLTTQAAFSAATPYGGLILSGLWPLTGATVTVWAGGLDCGDFKIVDGAITVPYGDGLSGGTANGLFTQAHMTSTPNVPVWCGLTYTSDGQIVRPNTPQETGARNGPGFMKLRRTNWWGFQVEGAVTGAISFGTDFSSLTPMAFKQPNGDLYTVLDQFTGIYRDSADDSDSFDSMICWRITRPYPANIVAVGGALDTTDI